MPVALVFVVGCSPTWHSDFDWERMKGCALHSEREKFTPAAVSAAALDWLAVVPFEAHTVCEDPPAKFAAPLDRVPGREYLALVSFPDPSAPQAPGRCYLYDNALALLWYTWTGEDRIARGIAETLLLLQGEDGRWGFSFSSGEDGYYNAAYVRHGAVAWAGYSLSYYAEHFHHEAARTAADLTANYLLAHRSDEEDSMYPGLVTGGYGCWAGEDSFSPDYVFPAAVTEHQLDSHMLLAHLRLSEATPFARRILDVLWLPDETRFAVAAWPDSVNEARALDAAGAFGALWLQSVGRDDIAAHSLDFAVRSFAVEVDHLSGYRPYLDPVDSPQDVQAPRLIFSEGSFALGLAAHRLGREDLAQECLQLAAALACIAGPGIPYANQDRPPFTVRSAAASTLWFLFLERETRLGEPAPLFPLVPSSLGGAG